MATLSLTRALDAQRNSDNYLTYGPLTEDVTDLEIVVQLWQGADDRITIGGAVTNTGSGNAANVISGVQLIANPAITMNGINVITIPVIATQLTTFRLPVPVGRSFAGQYVIVFVNNDGPSNDNLIGTVSLIGRRPVVAVKAPADQRPGLSGEINPAVLLLPPGGASLS